MKKIERITFVAFVMIFLQQVVDAPPQNFSMLPENFSMLSNQSIGGMARPVTSEQIGYLQDKGITLIVSLTPEPLSRDLFFQNELVRNIHIPIDDNGAPTYENAEKFLAIADAEIKKKGKVVVHCEHGVGRTGTMLALWLIHHEHMNAEQAIKAVNRRLHSAQKLFLRDFYNKKEKGLCSKKRSFCPIGQESCTKKAVK